MNFVVLAIFTLTLDGLNGAVILMLGHGVVSGALFLLIGVLYERYHSRNILYYGGLTQVMPLTSFLFFFFSISNFSFPGTANFIGEFLILKSVLQTNTLVTILLLISSVCTVGYSMFLYNRIFFGNLKITSNETFTDIKRFEFYYFFPLIITNLVIGLYPNIFLLPLQNTLYIFINFPII
jgi:NADH-quinone oxidoreductase subunit M